MHGSNKHFLLWVNGGLPVVNFGFTILVLSLFSTYHPVLDGWAERQTDRQTDRRTDGRTRRAMWHT